MEKLLTISEVAQRLRCSRWCIYSLVHAGKLPVVQFREGGRFLFCESDIEVAVKLATLRPKPGDDELAP